MGIYRIRTEFGHHLKFLMGLLAFIFIIGGMFMFGSGQFGGGKGANNGADNVIATVNGMDITRGEMDTAWDQQLEAVRDQPGMHSTLQLAGVRARVFQSLISSRIASITAEKMGVNISNGEVNAKRDELIVERLRESRRQVLGKISADEEKIDPRNDDDYKAELAKSKSSDGTSMTIAQLEQQAEQYITDAQIRQVLAMEGIQKSLKTKIGAVTPQDVTNSFNQYSFRVIMFPKNLPAAQLTTQVNKVDEQAKKGTDFVQLAKQYSKDATKGAVQTAEYGSVGSGVWSTLTAMKVGDISNPIDAGQAIYIVKLEDVKQKLPAKLDKKAQDDRKAMIENSRMSQEYMKFQDELKKDLQIKVTDSELNGYYLLSQTQQPGMTPAEAMGKMHEAQKAFEKAVVDEPNDAYAQAMLAEVLRAQGNDAMAERVLYQLLEGSKASGTGVDLRIMLGDLLAKSGKKAEAIVQYQKASDEAHIDVQMHKAIAAKFKAVGKPDLAAKENAMADDYAAKLKILQDQQTKAATKPKPGK